jgi:hypothetical protein
MKEMTKKLFYPVFGFVVALSLAVVASAQGAKTLTGHIVDKKCSSIVLKDGTKADNHSGSKGCAVGCADSGLGLYYDGKWEEFDAKSTDLAKAALTKASKEKGVKFKVVGELKDGKLAASEITEVK